MFNKNFIFGLIVLLFYESATGQGYSCYSIPDSLKINATSVLRFEENILTVKSISSATYKVHRVVTVLNKKGENSGQLVLQYDKFIIPSDIKIVVFDASGKILKKVKDSEIQDYSIEESSLFSDNRVKHYKPFVNVYPYSVEISYELEFKGYIGLPGWIPANQYNLSVEQSTYILNIRTEAEIKIKELNFHSEKSTSEKDGIKTIQWQLNGFNAIDEEPLSPSLEELTPRVIVASNKFFYDGYSGSLESWRTYNDWIQSLNEGRDNLPELTIQKIHTLTDTIKDLRQKANILYEYLQTRMRYVSIQLGIGGFQPFTAETVDKVGYGDCKALSNYYLAMLKAVGITAYYALVIYNPGRPIFYHDFPANIYFNHVIVCITFGNDTVWAECTNKYFPLGYLSSGVAGHPALIVTPEGGKLVTTPKSPAESNLFTRKCEIKLINDGKGEIKMETTFSGLRLAEGLGKYVKSPEDQLKNLYEDISLIDFNIISHKYYYQKNESPFIKLKAVINCNRLTTISGQRMFVPLKPLSDEIYIPEKVEARKTPFIIDFSYYDIDSIVMLVPQNYDIESIPSNSNIKSEFGTYDLSVNSSDAAITIVSKMKLNTGVFVSSEYDRYRSFLSDIDKDENQKIILKKITATK
jgi:transglutaminase-like putative cysteine protease